MIDAEIIERAEVLKSSDDNRYEYSKPTAEVAISAMQKSNLIVLGNKTESDCTIDEAMQYITSAMNLEQSNAFRFALEITNTLENPRELDPHTAKKILDEFRRTGIRFEDIPEKIKKVLSPQRQKLQAHSQKRNSIESDEKENTQPIPPLSKDELDLDKSPTDNDSQQEFIFLYTGVKEGHFPLQLLQVARMFSLMQYTLGLVLEKSVRNKKKGEAALTNMSHEEIIKRLKKIVRYIRIVNAVIQAIKNDMLVTPLDQSSINEDENYL